MTDISILTWDFNFRDAHHSIISLKKILDASDLSYEIIISGKIKLEANILSCMPMAKVIFNEVDCPNSTYHPGFLLNESRKVAKGNYLLICDGDLIFPAKITEYIEWIKANDYIGLAHRVDLHKFKENFWETCHYDVGMQHLKKPHVPKSINNYAPCVILKASLFDEISGFDNSNVFSTMFTKFCKDLVKRAEWESSQNAVVSLFPILHPWHPTPKNSLSRYDVREKNLRLWLQEILIFSYKTKLRRVITVIISVLFFRHIKNFNIKWRQP